MNPSAATQRTFAEEQRRAGSVGPPPPDERSEIRWARMDGRAVVVKVAGGTGRERLRREAEVLRCLPPGVAPELVELVEGADHTEMVSLRHGGLTFCDIALLDRDERAGALESLCGLVDTLHRAGWVHGSIEASHVLVDPGGQVRLASLGGASRPAPQHSAAMVAADNADFASVVFEALDAPPGFARSFTRVRCRRATSRARRRLERSRGLLNGASTAAVLRDAGVLRRPRGPGHRLSIPLVVAAGCACALGGVGAAWLTGGGTPGPPSCSIEVDGTQHPCDGAEVADGVVTVAGRHFGVGDVGDEALVGDWDCDGSGTVALLRRGSGELFHFETWSAPGETVAAERVGEFRGATGLESTRPCQLPQVRLEDGSLVSPLATGAPATDRTLPTEIETSSAAKRGEGP